MLNVLITGCCGHIGSYIIRKLPTSFNLTLVDDLSSQRYCSLFDLSSSYKFFETSFEKINKDVLRRQNIVIHLAAITNAEKSFMNTEEIEEVNLEKTKEFIDQCKYYNIPRFIFPSSTSVYGKSTDIVTENDSWALNPQSPYATAKLEIENYLRENYTNNYLILRFGTIFGYSRGIRFHTAINKFCYQAATSQPLTVWRDNINQYRPYLDIEDAFESILMFLKRNPVVWNDTYNVLTVNKKLTEVLSIIENQCEITFKRKPEISFVDTPLLNQYSYHVSDEKIRNIGFRPRGKMIEAIKETMEKLGGLY